MTAEGMACSNANKVQMKPYDYKTGGLDNDGVKVEKIYTKAIGYVVYRTTSAIKLDMDDDHPEMELYMNNHFRIGVDLARIYSWLPENLSWSEPINKQIARAMTTNVAGNYDEAKKMLGHAEERIIKLKTIQGRIQYTLSAFLTALLMSVIAFFSSGSAGLITLAMLCGALGGILSIAVGYSSLKIDIDANWATNGLIGSSRIIIAIIASVFSYLAISSGIAFSFIQEAKSNHGVLLVAMISGFAEMLVPNMMSNLARTDTGTSDGGGISG
nr:hypothetical protein [uncultured Pseudomonas sp.]